MNKLILSILTLLAVTPAARAQYDDAPPAKRAPRSASAEMQRQMQIPEDALAKFSKAYRDAGRPKLLLLFGTDSRPWEAATARTREEAAKLHGPRTAVASGVIQDRGVGQ